MSCTELFWKLCTLQWNHQRLPKRTPKAGTSLIIEKLQSWRWKRARRSEISPKQATGALEATLRRPPRQQWWWWQCRSSCCCCCSIRVTTIQNSKAAAMSYEEVVSLLQAVHIQVVIYKQRQQTTVCVLAAASKLHSLFFIADIIRALLQVVFGSRTQQLVAIQIHLISSMSTNYSYTTRYILLPICSSMYNNHLLFQTVTGPEWTSQKVLWCCQQNFSA